MKLEHLGKARTALIVVTEKNYQKTLLALVKQASKKTLCYVTLNKTHASLIELFKKNKISTKNIKFIDGISHAIRDVESTEDCTYISSPEAITELSIIVNTHLKYGFEYLIIDSMTNLLTYTDINTVKKLMKSMIAKINETKTKATIIALVIPEHNELIKAVSTFVDKVVKI